MPCRNWIYPCGGRWIQSPPVCSAEWMDQPRRSPFFLKGIHHTAVCHTYMVLHAGQYSIGPRNPGVGLGDPRHILTVQSPSCSFHCGMTGCHHCSGFWMVPQSIRNSGGRVYWEQILRPCIRHIPLHEACSGAGAKTLALWLLMMEAMLFIQL